MFTISERARFVTFPNNKLNYRTLEKEGTQKYRLSAVGTEALLFSVMGKMESFYHIRFYYEPYHFESNPKTITDFNNAIIHFWGWIIQHFEPIPNLPFFYQNSQYPVELSTIH